MNNLEQLLTPGAPIFDPENMTRELLFSRLTTLLERTYVDTLSLEEIRSLALDLSGIEKDGRRQRMPEKVHRLSCVDYADLSSVNRQEALHTVMAYVGLTDREGPELLGLARWTEIQRLIKAKVDGQSKTDSPYKLTHELAPEPLSQEETPVAREWSQKTVALKIVSLLDETISIGFYDLDRTRSAVNELRVLHGLAEIGKSARDPGFHALGSLNLKSLDRATLDGIPEAILDALALDAQSGPVLFGAVIWSDIAQRYSQGLSAGCPNPKRAASINATLHGNRTFFQWLMATVRRKK